MLRLKVATFCGALLFALAAPGVGIAMEKIQGYCEKGGRTVTTLTYTSVTKVQESFPSCTVTVYTAGVVTPLPAIYEDDLGTAKANPFTAGSDGYWYFYAPQGRYDVRFSGGGLPAAFTRGDWLLFDPDEADIQLLNNGVVYADRMPGADWCTQINNAVALLGDRSGKIIYSAFSGTKTCTAQPVLPYRGQVLYLQSGTYVLNKKGDGVSALMVTADQVEVYGDGPGKTIIRMGADAQDDPIRVAEGGNAYNTPGVGSAPIFDVTVHDLEVENTGAPQRPTDTYQNGIHFETPVRGRVYNTYVRDIYYQGIVMSAANWCSGNMVVNTNGTTVTVVGGDTNFHALWNLPGGGRPVPADTSEINRSPILINGVRYQIATITNAATATLATSAGVQAGVAARIYTSYDNEVHNNTIRRAGEFGLGVQAGVSHSTFSNNIIGDARANAHGIELKGSGGFYSDHNLILGNVVRGASGYGMWIGGHTRDLQIIGNNVSLSNYGIYADSESGAPNYNIMIAENTVRHITLDGITCISTFGAYVGTISGNQVSNVGSNGIVATSASTLLIEGNTVAGNITGDGIVVGTSTAPLISNNTVSGAGAGIDVLASVTGALVVNNMLVGNGAAWVDAGTRSVMAFNRISTATRTTQITGNVYIAGDQEDVIEIFATGGVRRGIRFNQSGVGAWLYSIGPTADLSFNSGGNDYLVLHGFGTNGAISAVHGIEWTAYTLAQLVALGALPDGSQRFCQNCAAASNPCSSPGGGAMAFRFSGAWDCR